MADDVQPVADPAPEAQPDRFPVDFDEWVLEVPRAYRALLAGFRHVVWAAGRIRIRQDAATWQREFEAFLARPTARGRRR